MVACWTPLLTGKKHGREKHVGNTKQANRNAKTKEQSNWHAIINQRNNIHFQSSINHVYSSWYWTAISGRFVYSPFHTATLHTDKEIVCHKLEVTIIFTEMRWSVEKAGQMAEAPSLACSASYQVALPEQYQPPFHMTNYQVCALGCWWKWCWRWVEGWSSCYRRKIHFLLMVILKMIFLYLPGEKEWLWQMIIQRAAKGTRLFVRYVISRC